MLTSLNKIRNVMFFFVSLYLVLGNHFSLEDKNIEKGIDDLRIINKIHILPTPQGKTSVLCEAEHKLQQHAGKCRSVWSVHREHNNIHLNKIQSVGVQTTRQL